MGGIPNNRFVISERREKVHAMLSQGLNEIEIAKALNVGQSTVSRDLKSIKKKSVKKIKSILADVLPFEYSKAILAMEQITKKCWQIINDDTSHWTSKNKLDAMKLLQQTIVTKFEIINQGPVSLRAQQLEREVKELVQEDEMPRRSFFTLGPPPDDLR